MRKKFIYKRIIAGVLVLAAGVGLVAYLLVMIQRRDAEASSLAADIQAQTIRETRLRSLKRTIAGTDQIRGSLDRYLVSADGVVGFIEDIENLGSVSGVSLEISSVGLKPMEGREDFEWLTLAISMSGSWSETTNALALIESLPYRVLIDDFSIIRGDAENRSLWSERIVIRVVKDK